MLVLFRAPSCFFTAVEFPPTACAFAPLTPAGVYAEGDLMAVSNGSAVILADLTDTDKVLSLLLGA